MMRRLYLKLAFLMACLFHASLVSAGPTWFLAGELDCESIADREFPSDREYAYELAEYFQCISFITALVQADALQASCVPEDVDLDVMRQQFVDELRLDEELRDQPAHQAMQKIFAKHYPCAQGESHSSGY